jgi:hypothetical protein
VTVYGRLRGSGGLSARAWKASWRGSASTTALAHPAEAAHWPPAVPLDPEQASDRRGTGAPDRRTVLTGPNTSLLAADPIGPAPQRR